MRAVLLFAGLLLLGGAHAQPAATKAETAEEAAARQKLERVRDDIRALSVELRETGGEKDAAATALREAELAIAGALDELRAIDAELVADQSELDALERDRSALSTKLKSQREALAELLRSAYALGRNEELKLLLQQEDVDTIARVLAYHRYFQRARMDRIDDLLEDLAQLAEVQKAIASKTAQLNSTRAQRETEVAVLDQRRTQRQAFLAEIDATLDDQRARLALMAKDEKAVVGLLERLRDVFADIPRDLDGAQPFASLRGRLAMPVRGQVSTRFGGTDENGRHVNGWLISADSGSEVRAVARGRVAYADWLKGYGMLLILDHGDGYMSLYGYNDALRKDVGDWVAPGETIAVSGASGGQRSPALYFELRLKGEPINPKSWLR